MLYTRNHEISGRVERRLHKAVNELYGSCASLVGECETLSYQAGMSVRGVDYKEIISMMCYEAANVLHLCGKIEVMLDEGAGLCRS
ncbi:MAG: hypothetical protein IJG36_12240 [Synergistaceae bacterium]|nr:hypothetical protein [Synergistaceae bacterium]